MKQVLFGGISGVLNDSATQYNRPFFNNNWTNTSARNYCVPIETTFRKLHVVLSEAPGAGSSYTFTLQKGTDGRTDTSISVTISGTDTEGSDLVNEEALAALDCTQLKCTKTGTPTFPVAKWSIEAEPTDTGVFITSGNTRGTTSGSATRFIATFGGLTSYSNELDARSIIPISGKIVGYGINLNASPGTGSDYTFDIYKNSSIVGSTTLTLSDSIERSYLSGLNVPVSPGDYISIRCVPNNGPTNRVVSTGVVYKSDTDGESFISGSRLGNLGGGTRYDSLHGVASGVASTTPGERYVIGHTDFTTTGISVGLEVAPGTGNGRTISTRKNDIITDSAVSINGTEVFANGLGTETYTLGDEIDIIWESAGSPANGGDHHVAITCRTGAVIPPNEDPGVIIKNIQILGNIVTLTS